jgi:hypothetical protein
LRELAEAFALMERLQMLRPVRAQRVEYGVMRRNGD